MQTALEQDTISLACLDPPEVDGSSPSGPVRYAWRMDDLLLPTAAQKRLVISPAMLWHSGRYSCRMSFRDEHGNGRHASGSVVIRVLRYSHYITYKASLKPQIHTIRQSAGALPEDAMFIAACLADRAKQTIWYYNQEELVSSHPLIARIQFSGPTDSVLKLINVRPSDSGHFECEVKNENGTQRRTFPLVVSSEQHAKLDFFSLCSSCFQLQFSVKDIF